MKLLVFILSFLCLGLNAKSQTNELSQTIRGTVKDQITDIPIPGATVVLKPSNPLVGTTTNANGEFRLENVALGRYSLEIKMMGYQNTTLPNIVVGSGKEIVLSVNLIETAVEMKVVEITAAGINKAEALNELTTVSARQFSIEETKRYAGALNDPGRMVQSFAGVTFNADGNNEIVVRGNSPRGMLWRMEGVEIPNPDHFSNQGASGGAISMLSNNMMANSDFLSGAFPADYGNAASGVFDMKLRKGNNEKRETAFQLGVIGADIALEGPINKVNGSSYLANYRYSSLFLLQKLGIEIVGDAVPVFQDLSFNISLPTENAGTFSLFGIGGLSSINEEYEGETLNYRDKFRTRLGVVGLTHSYIFNSKTWLKTIVAATHTNNYYEGEVLDTTNVYKYTDLDETYKNNTLRTSLTLNHKVNRRNSFRGGLILSNLSFNQKSVYYNDEEMKYVTDLDSKGSTGFMQAFSSWQYRLNDQLTFNAGLHYSYFLLNKNVSLEPRAGVKWNFRGNQVLSAGVGVHSRLEDMAIYFGQKTLEDETVIRPNRELGFSKSAHYVLGYETMLSSKWHLKTEIYYQDLFNVPVNAEKKDAVSLINMNEGFTTIDAKNTGTGRNYGLELTLEKYFSNSWYAMLTTSLYDSKYRG